MKRFFSAILLAVALTTYVIAAPPAKPAKAASVGDWVEMKTITEIDGKTMEQTIRQEVTKVEKTLLFVKNRVTSHGKTFIENVMKLSTADSPSPGKAEKRNVTIVEKIGEGYETLTLGGKAYKCHWIKKRMTTTIQGRKITVVSTAWNCPDVPVTNLVKRVIEQDGPKKFLITQALTNLGYGK